MKSSNSILVTSCFATLGVLLFTACPTSGQALVPPVNQSDVNGNPLAAPPTDGLPTPADLAAEDIELLTRGPLHEAFAASPAIDPKPGVIVPKEPPEDITEVPPENEQADDSDVESVWIPGYWAWDEDRNDFIWVSGAWRAPPPDRNWIPGYWHETENGYQWISGFWAPVEVEQMSYVEPPPPSVDYGPSIPAPSEDYFWIPGNWVYQTNRYDWRPGHWCQYQEDRVWVPAHYISTPSGCVYVSGYWDFLLPARGQLYAPVYFHRPVIAYRPHCPLLANNLFMHLFVSSHHRNYFFGDYYDVRYRQRGCYPLYQYGYASRSYDPLYAYYHAYYARRGIDCRARLRGWHDYYLRHAHYRPPRTWSTHVAFALNFSSHQHHSRAVLVRPSRHPHVAVDVHKHRSPKHDRAEIRRDQIRDLSRQRRRLEEDNALAMTAGRAGHRQRDARPRQLTIPDDLRTNMPRNRFSRTAHAHRSDDGVHLREPGRSRLDIDDVRNQRQRSDEKPYLGKRGRDLQGRGNRQPDKPRLKEDERSVRAEDVVRGRSGQDGRDPTLPGNAGAKRPRIDPRSERDRRPKPQSSAVVSDRAREDLKLRRTKTNTYLNALDAAAAKRGKASLPLANDAGPAPRSQTKLRTTNPEIIRGNNENSPSLRRVLDRFNRDTISQSPSNTQRAPKAAPPASTPRPKTTTTRKPNPVPNRAARNSPAQFNRTPQATPARVTTPRGNLSSQPATPKRIAPTKPARPSSVLRGRPTRPSSAPQAKNPQRSTAVNASAPQRPSASQQPASRSIRTPKALPPTPQRSAPKSVSKPRASKKASVRSSPVTTHSVTVQSTPRSVQRSRPTPSPSAKSLNSSNRQRSMNRAPRAAPPARQRTPKAAPPARQRAPKAAPPARQRARKAAPPARQRAPKAATPARKRAQPSPRRGKKT